MNMAHVMSPIVLEPPYIFHIEYKTLLLNCGVHMGTHYVYVLVTEITLPRLT